MRIAALGTLVLMVAGWAPPGGSPDGYATESHVAQVERRVLFGVEVSATIRLMRDASELAAPCVRSVYDVAIDDGVDAEWTRENRALWDDTQVLDAVESALRSGYELLPGPVPDLCIAIAARPDVPILRWAEGIGGATLSPGLVALFVAPSLSSEWLGALRFHGRA